MADNARALAHEILTGCIVMCPGELPSDDDHNDVCNSITAALHTARNDALEEIAVFADSMAEDERLLAKSARRPMLEVERTGRAAAAETIAKRCRALKDRSTTNDK